MKTFKSLQFTRFILVLFFWAFILAGCHKEKDASGELVNYVWDYAVQHPDGFTLDVETKMPVTSGIAVAYFETENSFGKESLDKVIEHALNHEKVVGGWFNGEDSLYYFDSDRIFAAGAYEDAMAFAKENLQLSIYDLTNDSLIWIEYPKLDCIYNYSKPGIRDSLIPVFK
jgi:fructokinase